MSYWKYLNERSTNSGKRLEGLPVYLNYYHVFLYYNNNSIEIFLNLLFTICLIKCSRWYAIFLLFLANKMYHVYFMSWQSKSLAVRYIWLLHFHAKSHVSEACNAVIILKTKLNKLHIQKNSRIILGEILSLWSRKHV